MAPKKTYFLVDTADFLLPPPAGPLALGSIIISPQHPNRPLNRTDLLPIPDEIAPTSFTETDWRKTVTRATGGSGGVYAQFLQLLGVGGEASISSSTSNEDIYFFQSMKTESFEPSDEYVDKAAQARNVKTFVKANWFGARKPVYMVTGLKTVTGARVTWSETRKASADGKVGVDLTSLGVPLTVGPKGSWSRDVKSETETSRTTNFVFAFRLRRVKYKHGDLQTEEYGKGAFLGDDLDSGEEEVLTEGLEDDDESGQEMQGATQEGAVDEIDEQECSVVRLTRL